MTTMSYRDVPGWFDFEDIYDQAIDEAGPGAVLIEVGVAYGKSLAYLAQRRAAVTPKATTLIIGVDLWELAWGELPTEYAGPRAACESYLSQCGVLGGVALLQMSSVEASRHVPGAASFVFIDASHDYESVRQDIEAWLPVVRPGGLIGGHDHTGAYPGVERAVTEIFGADGYERRGSSWLRRVPA